MTIAALVTESTIAEASKMAGHQDAHSDFNRPCIEHSINKCKDCIIASLRLTLDDCEYDESWIEILLAIYRTFKRPYG